MQNIHNIRLHFEKKNFHFFPIFRNLQIWQIRNYIKFVWNSNISFAQPKRNLILFISNISNFYIEPNDSQYLVKM